MRKATIKLRKVYYKNVEVEVDIPSKVEHFDIKKYLNSAEAWEIDELLEDELNKIPFSDGNGIESDDDWTDIEETTETIFEVREDNDLIEKGHLS